MPGLCLVLDMTFLKRSYELADAELTLPPPVFSLATNDAEEDTSAAALFAARARDEAVGAAYSLYDMALTLGTFLRRSTYLHGCSFRIFDVFLLFKWLVRQKTVQSP